MVAAQRGSCNVQHVAVQKPELRKDLGDERAGVVETNGLSETTTAMDGSRGRDDAAARWRVPRPSGCACWGSRDSKY